MNTMKVELAAFEKMEDLRPTLSGRPPCLSVYMPMSQASNAGKSPNAKQNELHWKECLRILNDRVGQFGPVGRELVESVSDWKALVPERTENRTGAAGSIAVFRSPDTYQVALLDGQVADRAVLGPHFHIRPLLPELVRGRTFYLLALGQKNTRLLRCTMHSSDEIRFPAHIKNDFEAWMNQAKPDHTAVYNAMSVAAPGASGPNALAPKGADREAKDEYLSHYCKQLDRGVNELLKGRTEPLVLCAVEYELPIYREVNTYPNLVSEEVRGAPNSLKSGEMHARAISALEVHYANKVDNALADWNHRVGVGASSRLKDVVTAAHDGRVLTLILSDSQEQTGIFDQATHSIKGRETGSAGDEDLVNDAAVQTILHGGNVLIASHRKMPNGSVMAATFRY